MPASALRAQEIFKQKPPPKKTQREKIMWIQENRISGTWAKCSLPNCQKWRYLKNIYDPVDIPTEWHCSMNHDMEYNGCDKPQSPIFEDIPVVKLKYTAGSLVWVNSTKYMRWPAMVDDDPQLAQFYWLDWCSTEREAGMYHVVFIGKDINNISRQWFPHYQLEAFTFNNSRVLRRKFTPFLESVRVAREALNMNIFQRLLRFSFTRHYRGHIYSCGHSMRSVLSKKHKQEDPGFDSDCTLLSSTSGEEESYHKKKRGYLDNSSRRRKRTYPENSPRQRKCASPKNTPIKERRKRSSAAPGHSHDSKYRRRGASEDHSDRRRAFKMAPRDYYEDHSQKKRNTSQRDLSNTRSKAKSTPSTGPSKHCGSVLRDRRSCSVTRSASSETSGRSRASSVGLHGEYYKSTPDKKITPSFVTDDYDKGSYSRNSSMSQLRKRSGSVTHDYSESSSRQKRASSRPPDGGYSELNMKRKASSDHHSFNRGYSELNVKKKASSVHHSIIGGYSELNVKRKASSDHHSFSSHHKTNSHRKKSGSSTISSDHHKTNKLQKKNGSFAISTDDPGRLLRSQARNNIEPLYERRNITNSNVDLHIFPSTMPNRFPNKLYYPNGNSFSSEKNVTRESISLLERTIGNGGMIKKTVYKFTTRKWRISGRSDKPWHDFFNAPP